MQLLKVAAPLLTLAALVTACGGKPNPVAPNAPAAPAGVGLIISGADALLTGTTAAYAATLTLSDGSTRTVTPSWSSSAAGVATVDNAGRLAGRAHGSTTVTAAFEGLSASKTVQVVNNYGGSWSGRYVVRACKDSGVFTDGIYGGSYPDVPWCRAFDGVGSEHSFAFTIVQTGSTYGEIRATFGLATDTIAGTVTSDGRLNLSGTLPVLDWYGDRWGDLQFSGWDTTLAAADSMTGRWTQNLTMVGQQGSGYEEVELITMSRVPSAAAAR